MLRLLLTLPLLLAPLGAAQARDRPLTRAESQAIAREEARRARQPRAYEGMYGPGSASQTASRPLPPGGRGTMAVPNR